MSAGCRPLSGPLCWRGSRRSSKTFAGAVCVCAHVPFAASRLDLGVGDTEASAYIPDVVAALTVLRSLHVSILGNGLTGVVASVSPGTMNDAAVYAHLGRWLAACAHTLVRFTLLWKPSSPAFFVPSSTLEYTESMVALLQPAADALLTLEDLYLDIPCRPRRCWLVQQRSATVCGT